MLRGSVTRHLVLELAALLGEGADAFVDPLVAVDFYFFVVCSSSSRGGTSGSSSVAG